MTRIDANVILRYLLNDHDQLSERAAGIIDHEETFASVEVMCEVVYVLCGVYKVDRKAVSDRLSDFADHPNIAMTDSEVFLRALNAFSGHNIDFVDSLLLAYSAVRGDKILTFDKKLARLIG